MFYKTGVFEKKYCYFLLARSTKRPVGKNDVEQFRPISFLERVHQTVAKGLNQD